MSTAETADNAGKIAEEEPALEGSVVQEGERIHVSTTGGEPHRNGWQSPSWD